MYLVAGLGNPGKQYEATRHNMGFDTIDYLIEEYKVPQGGVKFNAMYGKTMIGGEKVILMKPLSFIFFTLFTYLFIFCKTLQRCQKTFHINLSVSTFLMAKKRYLFQHNVS